jgi:hypothetical protein
MSESEKLDLQGTWKLGKTATGLSSLASYGDPREVVLGCPVGIVHIKLLSVLDFIEKPRISWLGKRF